MTVKKSATKSTSVVPLEMLAATANKEHAATEKAAVNMLEHARKAGEALAKAKATVGHGRWSKWLKESFRGSDRTARDYMRVAANWQNSATLEAKSIKEVLDALAKPSDAEMLESGNVKRIESVAGMKVYVRCGKKDDPPKEAKPPPADELEVVEADEATAPTGATPKEGEGNTGPKSGTGLDDVLTKRWDAFMEGVAVADYDKVRQFLRDKLERGLDR